MALKLNDVLDSRFSSNSNMVDTSFESIFTTSLQTDIRLLEMKKIRFFTTADLRFRKYTTEELADLADSIRENGLLYSIIVRPIPETDEFELLDGEHRFKAHQINGDSKIMARVINADDARATMVATVTNLKRRMNLLISEKGFAYKAQLEAMKHQGRSLPELENVPGKTSREKVAYLNDVEKEHMRQCIRCTFLIPELLDLIDKKRIGLYPGAALSYYSEDVQAFILKKYQEGMKIDKKLMSWLRTNCPPDKAAIDDVQEALGRYTRKNSTRSDILVIEPGILHHYDIPDNIDILKLFCDFLEEKFKKAGDQQSA